MSLFSSRVQSLGASPISYHSLLHLSVGCAKVRDLSCHHGDTCGKAAPSWQIGFPWTASLTQDFPSLLCPFQIFCYNKENSSENRDLLPLRGESWHELLQTCFNEPHSETRKCDGWSKLLTLLGLKFSYWLSALSGRKEGWSSSFRLSMSWSCQLSSVPWRHGLWTQLWTKRHPSSSVRRLVTAVNQPNNMRGLPKRFAKRNSKSKP